MLLSNIHEYAFVDVCYSLNDSLMLYSRSRDQEEICDFFWLNADSHLSYRYKSIGVELCYDDDAILKIVETSLLKFLNLIAQQFLLLYL